MAELVLGPLLRWVGETEATVWVETGAACEVEVLGVREPTFHVEGHHYALVTVGGLEPGSATPYEVRLDGERCWPPAHSPFPPSEIRTQGTGSRLRLAFGSCRLALPETPSETRPADEGGAGWDALAAVARRMAASAAPRPDCLVLLGDQVYADEASPRARDFYATRRDPEVPPGLEASDFEEYTRLYWESWQDPLIRWLLSTVPSVMIFDDHEVHDDWNTSAAWIRDMWRKPWWEKRIVGGYMSYWIYQHLGNLSPHERESDPVWRRVRAAADAGPVLRELGNRSARTPDGGRWSFFRDFGRTRLVMIDTRGGRHFADGRRSMVDDEEWRWIVEHAQGGVDHLLVGSSLPVFLLPALQDLEAWNEAVCAGAWTPAFEPIGERIRRGLDLEHWAAFRESLGRLVTLLRAVGAGERGEAPASIVLLSGDVHNAYLAEVVHPRSAGVTSRTYQAVCSPLRNPLNARERGIIRFSASRAARIIGRVLTRLAGLRRMPVRWRLVQPPEFGNLIGALEIDGRRSQVTIERVDDEAGAPRLRTCLERRLA